MKCIFFPDCKDIERYECLHKHELECKFNRVKCPNYDKCKSYFKIQNRNEHLATCIMNDYPCTLCNMNEYRFDNVRITKLKRYNASIAIKSLQRNNF